MLLKLAWGNVRKSARDFAIYFVTVALGVAVFYAFNSITDQQAVGAIGNGSNLRELLNEIISYVSVFIVVVLGFLVIYANRFLIRRRSKEFGLYLVMGMRTSQVVGIVGLETLIVGVISLVIGFIVGFGFSYLIMLGTAALFQETIEGFAMGISVIALLNTIAIFAIIFVIAALINARRIATTPLINLLHADRKNERLVLRNLPLSVILFIISVALIGFSYHLLIENGLLEPSPEFLAATIIVCIGTWLFFYSLSGFLLRLIQWIRPLYFRGLNMFTMRQLNAKLNTTVASMTIVCITLFLSITSVCGGIGIVNAMNRSVEDTTAYDASVNTNWTNPVAFNQLTYPSGPIDPASIQENLGPYQQFAESCNYDMEKGLVESARNIGQANIGTMIDRTAQIDQFLDPDNPLQFGDFEQLVPKSLGDFMGAYIDNEEYRALPISTVRLSEVNAALKLAGKDTISLKDDQALIIYNVAYTAEFWEQFKNSNKTIDISGKSYQIVGAEPITLETTPMPLDTGSVILPDNAITASAIRIASYLDVQLKNSEDQDAFSKVMDTIHESTNPETWPIQLSMTRDSVYTQTSGLTGIIAFLAIYIGFILTIACAAILAIQQLSEASDNAKRYGLLRKLGTPESMITTSLFTQICIYFLAPLLLALCHTVCAMGVLSTVIAVFGNLDIGETALMTAGAFLITYGIYFLLTFFTARKLTK